VPDAADVVRLAAALIASNGGLAEGAGLPATPLYLRAPDVTAAPARRQSEAASCNDAVALRAAGAFDLDILAALHAACFADAWSVRAMAALLATPGTFALIAAAGGEPAGFVMARVAAEEAEVLSLCVLPAHRRGGIGRRLLDRAGALAVQRGAAALFLEVAEDDPGARQFYAASGFAQVGRRADYYRRPAGRRASALVLRRQLPNWSQRREDSVGDPLDFPLPPLDTARRKRNRLQ
jgi:ribosomal-protein-alanine N-acetyltransferase